MSESDFDWIMGSGNVFRDLGDPHADLKQAKAVLAARITALLDKRDLSVRKAANLSGFAAADFSRIRNADLRRFTLDQLMKIPAILDESLRVKLHVTKRQDKEAVIVTTGYGAARKTLTLASDVITSGHAKANDGMPKA